MDILFLTYANSFTQPLPALSEEDDAVYRILMPRALQQHYLIHRDSYANLAKISEFLVLCRDRISVFHYSGHAGQHALYLDDQAARSQGIAHLLGQCKNLKLVVLNGCSSSGQVNGLLEAGVPAVIATHAPVGDKTAALFATRFYQGLAQNLSISESFEIAIGETMAGKKLDVHRGAILPEELENVPLWGLYYKEEKAINEKLPLIAVPPTPGTFSPNTVLINSLWKALVEENENIAMLANKPGLSLAKKRMEILNNLPAPVAEHLRKLMVPVPGETEGYDKISQQRLQQIVRAYETTAELLVFTLMAQFWEACFNIPDLSISQETADEVRLFFSADNNKGNSIDYVHLLQSLEDIITRHGYPYFMEEAGSLKNMIYEQGPFQEACLFLEALRVQLRNGQPLSGNDELNYLCERAEDSLARLFEHLGFLSKYVMATVQDIDIRKYRHSKEVRFSHSTVYLRDLLGGMDITNLVVPGQFMDNRSVIIMKADALNRLYEGSNSSEEQPKIAFLNLSPFIIDANAFEMHTDVSKIYFVSAYDNNKDKYTYKYIYKPDDSSSALHIPDATNQYETPDGEIRNRFEDVKMQLDSFWQLLNDKTKVV